jgi:hypothetical protein
MYLAVATAAGAAMPELPELPELIAQLPTTGESLPFESDKIFAFDGLTRYCSSFPTCSISKCFFNVFTVKAVKWHSAHS